MRIIHPKDENTAWQELAELLHEAFQERLDQGLHFSCSFMTAEEIEQESKDCVVLVAVDKDDDNRLVGTVTLKPLTEHKAEHCNLAVSPSCRHAGVATRLLKALEDLALQRGCDHIISDTAEQAHSSVAWHKKNGFYPISLHAFWDTNYYSIIFRKQLKHHWLWSNRLLCAIRFAVISPFYKIYRNSDSTLTQFGELIFLFRKFRRKLWKN